MANRPPIVVIMGSVDHGKTTLLDYIRKANVAAKEAGGITQSVGAYEIIHPPHESQTNAELNAEKQGESQRNSAKSNFSANGRKITFIDTPGHEAFTKIKTRGAQVADIAILVVAADDSVQPQTKEAVRILKETGTPFIVAINKVDRQPDISRVKNDLLANGVLLEGRGGDISYQEISAKTGKGVDELLDLILLASELEHSDYDPGHHASGFVLEAELDSRRGVVATLIITDGTLKAGDGIAAGTADGKVKILENFMGKKAESLAPSSPAVVIGFNALPKAGDSFHSGPDAKAVESVAAKRVFAGRPGDKKDTVINLILRADVTGSLEAISQVIRGLTLGEGQRIGILDEAVGEITDGDVKSAANSNALIIGFKTKTTKPAEVRARAQNVKIVESEIIYDLLKAVEEALAAVGRKAAKGKLEILATFSKKGTQQVIGGEVKEGNISNNSVLEIERKEEMMGTGRVINLQQNKKDAKSVSAGNQCGLMLDSQVEIKVGDFLISH